VVDVGRRDQSKFSLVLLPDPSSWAGWRALLIAAMGETLHSDERELFKQLTQREKEPGKRVDELVVVAGRRAGKSRSTSVLAAYIAGLCDHPSLVPGEKGIVLIFAPDQRQSAVVLDYITAVFQNSLMLSQLVVKRTQRALVLMNRITIIVRSSDFRRIRGATLIAVIADELAFLRSDDSSSNPDTEILNAVRPGLATTAGPMFCISSPYARKGELYNLYQRHFGHQGDPSILVPPAGGR
jgi:hypothetical protein